MFKVCPTEVPLKFQKHLLFITVNKKVANWQEVLSFCYTATERKKTFHSIWLYFSSASKPWSFEAISFQNFDLIVHFCSLNRDTLIKQQELDIRQKIKKFIYKQIRYQKEANVPPFFARYTIPVSCSGCKFCSITCERILNPNALTLLTIKNADGKYLVQHICCKCQKACRIIPI